MAPGALFVALPGEKFDGADFVEEAFRKGSVRDREVRIRARSGSVHTLLLSASIETLGDERYIVSFARDITERKKTEEMLRQALERAEQSDRL